MDYGFQRPREPWEASDGAARALAALAGGAAPAAVPALLPALAEAARVDHFRRCRQLQATVWRALPRIFHGLGKRARPAVALGILAGELHMSAVSLRDFSTERCLYRLLPMLQAAAQHGAMHAWLSSGLHHTAATCLCPRPASAAEQGHASHWPM